jgi:hypothetical protein
MVEFNMTDSLLKKTHMLRCGSKRLAATYWKYALARRFSRVLPLDLFEQPATRVFQQPATDAHGD